jgi:hypothetical protein
MPTPAITAATTMAATAKRAAGHEVPLQTEVGDRFGFQSTTAPTIPL